MGEKASMWNLWHGCHKLSEGCRHCYVYRTDGKYGKDSSVVAVAVAKRPTLKSPEEVKPPTRLHKEAGHE